MDALFSLLGGLGPILQVVLIVAILVIFWEPIAERIGWKSKKEDEPSVLESLLAQMQTLSEHYNHDTTEILTSMRDSLKQIAATLDAINRMQEKLMTDHGESRELLRDFDKHGIKVRDCDVE